MKKILSFLTPLLLFVSVAAGQAVRFNVSESPRVTLLAVDCLLIIFSIIFFSYLLSTKNLIDYLKKIWKCLPWRILIIFLVWAVISLAINSAAYSSGQILNAFSYWARLSILVFNVTVMFYLLKERIIETAKFLENFLIWSAVILVFGYLQLIFVPDFSFMALFGWDPHQGRMLSTFFDPNYLGAFLVLLLSVLLGVGLGSSNRKLKNILIAFFILSWIALYFTYSRSAWAQGAIALPLVAYRKNWKLALGVLAIFIIMVFVPTRLGSRIAQSGSIFQSSSTSTTQDSDFDPSAAARGESLKRGLKLATNHWLYGVGYNAYGTALTNSGLSKDKSLTGMSSQGSDSSLLNIFATTGIVGLVLFLSFFTSLGFKLFLKFKEKKDWLAWSLLSFLVAWIAGSFFNNTLLYILILLPFLVLISTALADNKPNQSNDYPKDK
ncbi:MAG: O-antigen ligase family protein [Patescibacteria group bacterium]